MKRRMKVTVMLDEATVPEGDPGFEQVPEEWSTEHHVILALRNLEHQVDVLPVGRRVEPIVESLGRIRPDIVFNLTELFRDDRRHDTNIAALLEMLDVRYTGAGPLGLMLCRNKGLCKQLLSTRKIRVPGFAVLTPGKVARIPKSLRFPLVVKPLFEDGSTGISNASLVSDLGELKDRVQMVHDRWKQPAIAEEYIDGRELYVGLLGNQRVKVLPAREVTFGNTESGAPKLATYHVKWNEQYQEKWRIDFGFADLDRKLAERVARVCRRAYHLLQIHDYGRIDLRITPEGDIFVLEANPNPDIAYGEEVAEAADRAGIPYEKLIDRILSLALKRYGAT